MKRRIFLHSGSAVVAAAVTGCGGGGGGSDAAVAGDAGTAVSSAELARNSANLGGSTGTPSTPSTDAPAPQPQQPEQPTSNVPGIGYPFGSRLTPYVAGILPNNASNASMDAVIRSAYDRWKANGIVDVPTVPGGKALRFTSSYITVSEGMGYAMLLAVVMAGHDPNARALFDALLTTVRARPAYSIPTHGRYLMDWRLTANGSSTDAAGGGWNAMDGDLDIALALLMADKQWGSGGSWNYKQEGINTINAMKAWNMKPDGTTKGLGTPDVSRTSDYMIGHFRAFAKATGDSYWSTTVIDRCYWLINRMQTVYSPSAGLMPDFIVQTNTSAPVPSPGFMGDGVATEMYYYANAQRNPWRWGTDYVLSGDVRWKNVVNKMMAFFKSDTGSDPARTATGYHLDGVAVSRTYPDWTSKGMVGPQLCGAMVDPAHQAYLNSLWTYNANNFVVSYYESELQLIPMLVASGNWWTV
ncbi:MAG TPA: glycosyl hydrolase family 8 [Ramlibacter sp.]|uniref:glycosyl hydrolase family 8 n=1 Tax=Ramlibacter sp. TaxID=1917967 RepID=UPI002D61A853|nr:glycosyl hydrolase family 8 [Ramlibacter sp.]HZY17708.1 glycosyl hydrolase family 8 [Ramlibacter sp.]